MSIRSLALIFSFVALLAGPALGGDPMAAVRAFCAADATGARLEQREWPRIAPWVTWQLEPAWDRIELVRGYEVRTPRTQDGKVSCEVKYTVVGEIVAGRSIDVARVESVTFPLVLDGSGEGWRISGPPPIPHVSADRVDRQAMADLLDPKNGGYVSAASFVVELLRGAGWELPGVDLSALLTTTLLETVQSPEIGDLVLYLDAGRPYQAGVLESEDRVVSMTLNGGLRRAPVNSFAGEVVYRRLLPAAATPAPSEGARESDESGPAAAER